MPICNKCKKDKSNDDFYSYLYKGIKKLDARCKDCKRIESRIKYHKIPIEINRKRWGNWRKTPTGLFHSYRKNARYGNVKFDLFQEIFQHCLEQPCYYCGSIPTKDKPHGLDKIDPKKGYVVDNIVVCCWKCNSMKGRLNINDFLSQCRIIDNFRGKREDVND